MTKSFGKPPVLMSRVNPELRAKVANELLRSNGYFDSNVEYDVITQKNPKKAKIGYTVSLGNLYRIDSLRYVNFPPRADSLIRSSLGETLIHPGDPFKVSVLDAERTRLSNVFRNNGYYYYQPGYASYLADTVSVADTVQLRLQFADSVPDGVRIIDLAQDFRLAAEGNDFVYGLPEINRGRIASAVHVANPGCFATCIQLGLLPAAKLGLLTNDVSVNAITGSTGAGQKPGATTHFSWRAGNMSIYKPFTHQHVPEIRQSLEQLQGTPVAEIDFIPYRGPFARGIFATEVVRTDAPVEEVIEAYKAFYRDEPFTHYVDKPLDM